VVFFGRSDFFPLIANGGMCSRLLHDCELIGVERAERQRSLKKNKGIPPLLRRKPEIDQNVNNHTELALLAMECNRIRIQKRQPNFLLSHR
jgi:hypothetical protein